MAITHVAAIGSNGSKTTGTTLAVTATPSTQPAAGDLIVVACARDDIATDPLTGDSCSDGHGNTYQRIVFGNAAQVGNVTAADAPVGVLFYSVLSSAWSGSTTVTWTHPSLDARGMQVEHFAPTSGYTILFQESATNSQAASTSSSTAQLAHPTVPDDLVFGLVAVEIDSTSSITGDSDTNGGASWSSLTASAGTSGGTAATNIFVATQYKVAQTLPFAQGYNVTGFTSADSVVIAASFHEIPSTGVAFIGASKQVFYAGSAISPAIPPNSTTNDLLLMVIGGRPSSSSADGISIASGADGWAQHGSTSYLAVASADDVSVQIWWKIHDGSESAPSVSANAVLTASGGYSAQILAFRRMDTSTPFDVTPVNSSNGAAATWTPTAVTTVTAGAMALSAVTTSDDNALNFNTAQGFTLVFGGAEYDDTTGTDYAVGAAYKTISSPGSVTQPTWNQSVNGNDSWVGIATALKPASSFSTVNGTADGTFTFTGAATGTRTVLGAAVSTFTFTVPAVGTRTTFGTAASTFVFTGAATGTRTVFGQAASSFTFTGDAAGTPTVTGQATSTFTFTGAATGTRTVLGQADGTFTFTGPASGAPEIAGTADGTFVFTASAVGTHVVAGAAASAFIYTADAAGLVTHSGTADGTFTFTGDAAGSVSRTGSIDTLFVFSATAVGLVIPGVNATLRGLVLATVVDTSIQANVVDTSILVSVGDDRIEASVR